VSTESFGPASHRPDARRIFPLWSKNSAAPQDRPGRPVCDCGVGCWPNREPSLSRAAHGAAGVFTSLARGRRGLVGSLRPLQNRVHPAVREKLIVRASFDDAALIQDEDDVGFPDRGEAMGNDERGLAFEEAVQPVEHEPLRLRIEAGARLIEDHDRRVADHGPCDAEPLTLTSRKRLATLPDDSLVSLGQRLDELVSVRQPLRANVLSDLWPGIPDRSVTPGLPGLPEIRLRVSTEQLRHRSSAVYIMNLDWLRLLDESRRTGGMLCATFLRNAGMP